MRLYLLFFIVFFLVSCKSKLDDRYYNKWKMLHLIIDEDELFNNDLKVNKFNIPDSKTSTFIIEKSPKLLLIYLDIYDRSSINAEYEILDINKIRIVSCEKEELLGEYDLIFTEKEVDLPDIKAIEYNLILRSKRCSFYLKRYVLHPDIPKPRWR